MSTNARDDQITSDKAKVQKFYLVDFTRQEHETCRLLQSFSRPVNFPEEERGWSYMKVVIRVGSYIKPDDLSLGDSQDRTLCGYECVFPSVCAEDCVSHSLRAHPLLCFLFNLISALNMLIRKYEMLRETRGLLADRGISSGIGLHWLKIIIDLLMELSVSAQLPGAE